MRKILEEHLSVVLYIFLVRYTFWKDFKKKGRQCGLYDKEDLIDGTYMHGNNPYMVESSTTGGEVRERTRLEFTNQVFKHVDVVSLTTVNEMNYKVESTNSSED